MELYLHVGTNKTGSSYLQTLLTINKKAMLNSGIYIPSSKWDKDMGKGEISPGNGHLLAKLLSNGDQQKLESYLINVIKKTRSKSVSKLCLSNEVIIRLFSNPVILENFVIASKKAEISKINVLCLIRNPYEHALSLYRHRMKYGVIKPYKNWMNEGYETLRLFERFIGHYNKHELIEWKFDYYRNTHQYLLKLFFGEFLNVNLLNIKDFHFKTINESLNLKLINILQLLESKTPGISIYFHKNAFKIKESVVDSEYLRMSFYYQFKIYSEHHQLLIENLSKLLPEKDQIEFLNKPTINLERDNDSLFLKEEIINCIAISYLHYLDNKMIKQMKIFYRNSINIFRKGIKFNTKEYGGTLRP